MATGTVLEPRGAGVSDARGRRAASPRVGGWEKRNMCGSSGSFNLIFGASFARIRERRAGLLLPEDRALVW